MGATPLTPVILCGGTGTRLWPLSRASYPQTILAVERRQRGHIAAADPATANWAGGFDGSLADLQ